MAIFGWRPAYGPLAMAAVGVVCVASEARAADTTEAIFALYVNTVPAGDVRAVLRGGDVLIERSVLESAGLKGFTAQEEDFASGSTRRRLISLASVKPALRFVIDEAEVAIRVQAPVELLPKQAIDLSPAPKVSYERRESVFFNYSPSLTTTTTSKAEASTFFETGVSERNRLWYSGLQASTMNGVARGLTNVTIDDRPKMVKLTVGDSSVSAGALGGAAIMGGITLAKDFSMNPYFVRFPSMRFASATEVPANLDVYVNGIRVRSQPIQPGTFTLDNVRGLVGAGRITYVVRDALGRQQVFSSPYYVAPTVLAKGVDDYAVSFGLQRERVGVESFSYDVPTLIAYYQRGLSDRVTFGGRSEARLDRASGGPYVAVTTPVGIFALEGGASITTDGDAGAAGVGSYSYISRYFNASASLRTLTNGYSTSTLAPEVDRSTHLANVTLSAPVNRRSSISTLFSLGVARDNPTQTSVGLLSQTQLTTELALIAQVALASYETPKAYLDGFLTLSWVPHTNVYASAGVERTQGVTAANLQVAKSQPVGEGWSMNGALKVTDEDAQVSVLHRLQAPANVISTYFDRNEHGSSLTVNPAGSVVWVKGSGLWLTRPVYDSFALVRVPKLQNVRVYLNSQEVGRTNEEGELVVPGLVSYYGSQLKIASEDVPMSYQLDGESSVAAPPRRGAAFVEFGAHASQYLRGRLRLAHGTETTIPLYGDVVVDPGAPNELVSPIGDDGTFELEGVSPGTHDAEVRYQGKTCRLSLAMPTSEKPIVDVGLLTCETTD